MTGNPAPTVLLTRPKAQAEAYAAELAAELHRPCPVMIAPLIEITPLAPAPELEGIGTLLFTSTNGVAGLAALTPRRDIPALCVGERTAARAEALGFRAIAAGGDADSLIALARARGRGRLLYPRGQEVARDLAAPLRDAGFELRELVVYRQTPRPLTAEARALIAAGNPVLLPLFSPRSARLFLERAARLDLSRVTAICLSENVAGALPAARFSALCTAAAPAASAVTREIAARL